MAETAPLPQSNDAGRGGRARPRRPRNRNRGGAGAAPGGGVSVAQTQDGRMTVEAQSGRLLVPMTVQGGLASGDVRANPLPNRTTPQAQQGINVSGDVRANPLPNRNGDGRGGRRGGRGGARGGRPPRDVPVRPVYGGAIGGRTFGGQLTGNAADTSAAPNLSADAPAFTPGQPIAKSQPRPPRAAHNHPPAQKQRRYSKSLAEDIATRTHEDILHGLYECPICTSEVLKNSKVWSCKTCWTVFHMTCIKKWASNQGSTQQNRPAVAEGELPPERQWRCPGCNLPKDDMPKDYECWCGKEVNPKAVPGLPPHSCGQTCGKSRKCPHPCAQICHAGPCQPCDRMGPKTACFCGNAEAQKKCVDTDYEKGWSCGKKHGVLLGCEEHECQRSCHDGSCGPCEVMVEAKCYCGKVAKEISCSERGKKKDSSLPKEDGTVESWVGSFECGNVCKRAYDCGKHFCEKRCHEQTAGAPHCPQSPDKVNHCPCGKTTLKELSCVRTSCEDPIPHCDKPCMKQLACGHNCQMKCHEGNCYPCLQVGTIDCRCGRTTSRSICHQGMEEKPQCMRICRTVLNCGRHECGDRCCPGEQHASARLAAKRKMKASARGAPEDFEAEHICTRTCGRELKCGNPEHVCQDLCHRGPCRSCREAVFDEIACNCGRTVLYPPQPCGTQPPPCPHQCKRPKTCGHPQTQHSCHGDEESCPKCPYLVEKACMCGKKVLKNQPCWSQSVSCGQTCDHRLRCGIHFCQKSCHRPGECEDAALAHCPHICGKTKTAEGCGHPCLDTCHAPYPCKEDKPCQAKVIITCECQRNKLEVKCNASKPNPVPERKTLPCDDECLRIQRNAKLAAALNINPDHEDGHIPYSAATLDYFKDHVKWCQVQEREFRVFAADDTEKRMRFKPMQAAQRSFLHSLADDFGLDSEGVDPEPHRHVVVFKTPAFVKAPMKTLSQCKRIAPVEEKVSKPSADKHAFNAIVLAEPRFALTIDELRSDLGADPRTAVVAGWKIEFLPSEEIVLHGSLADGVDEGTVVRLKPLIAEVVKAKELAKATSLCAIDSSLNVVRREEDMAASAGGWSQVVKGAGNPMQRKKEAETVSGRNAFAILGGNRIAERKKREKEEAKKRKEAEEALAESWEDVVDDEGEEIVKKQENIVEADGDVAGPAPKETEEVNPQMEQPAEQNEQAQASGSGSAAPSLMGSHHGEAHTGSEGEVEKDVASS